MPTPMIKSFAKKSGKTVQEVDKLWKQLRAEYGDDYKRIVGSLKKILNINESFEINKYLKKEYSMIKLKSLEEVLESQMDEEVKVTTQYVVSYFKQIQKIIGAKGFDISSVDSKGLWYVTFNSPKIFDKDIILGFKNIEGKKVGAAKLIGYGFPNDKFYPVPSKLTSIKDIKKYATVMKNSKGSSKTLTQLSNSASNSNVGIGLSSVSKYKKGTFGYWWTVENGNDDIIGQVYKGNLICRDNKLTSLEGCPKEIDGKFDCSGNNLTSLEGAPEIVKGDFNCVVNYLTSLEGAPEIVKGDFDCTDNKLTSLKGAPEKVYGWFYCGKNSKKFTDEDVRKVSDVKGEIIVESLNEEEYKDFFNKLLKKYDVKSPDELSDADKKKFFDEVNKGWTSKAEKNNESVSKYKKGTFGYWWTEEEGNDDIVGQVYTKTINCSNKHITSLEGSPKEVDGNFNCSDNYLTSLEGCPQTVKGNFICDYNKLTSLEGAPTLVTGDFICGHNPRNFTDSKVKNVSVVKGNIVTESEDLSIKALYELSKGNSAEFINIVKDAIFVAVSKNDKYPKSK